MEKALIAALRKVLEANDDFRRGMPDAWEGDPLQDACAEAREVLLRAENKRAEYERRLAAWTKQRP